MFVRLFLSILFSTLLFKAESQCILVPSEVCLNQCGPVFYLVPDPPGTTYEWSISCGTITNETEANPHVACFTTAGICTLQVIVTLPFEEPDTCIALVDVKPLSYEEVINTICPGDSIEINGTYFEEGVWTDTLFGESSNGCDSILLITINSYPPIVDTQSYVGCAGDGYSLVINGTTYDEINPTGTEILIASNGCDSTIYIELIFNPLTTGTFTYEGCEGDGFSIEINGITYDESNPTGIEVFPGSNGCDSTVTINCIFYPPTFGSEFYLGCEGDGYFVVVDSVTYNESNPTGLDTLMGSNGCDSIVTIDLQFLPLARDTISYVGCMGDGYSIEILGETFDESNPSGTITIIPADGCDSVITIDLQFFDCIGTLTLNGNQLCVSDTADQYQWFDCDWNPLPDTTQCITVIDSGCACVIVTDSLDIDTVCNSYLVCELVVEIIADDTICSGDSVLFTFSSNAEGSPYYYWTVELDTLHVDTFILVDSLFQQFNAIGNFPVTLTIEEGSCTAFSSDTVEVFPVPETFICCDQATCDTCITVDIYLSGTPPFTIAISNGSYIDTIYGIDTSVYQYNHCPPALPAEYHLLWMEDSGGDCEAIVYDSIVTIWEAFPLEPMIVYHEDTLCAEPTFDGALFSWRHCEDQVVLSYDQCFVPSAPGCYCVTISAPIGVCPGTTCDVFTLDNTIDPGSASGISLWYNRASHSIDIKHDPIYGEKTFVQLTDIQGRNVTYQELEVMNESVTRIHLSEPSPSWLFVTIYNDQFRTTKGIFIPTY